MADDKAAANDTLSCFWIYLKIHEIYKQKAKLSAASNCTYVDKADY